MIFEDLRAIRAAQEGILAELKVMNANLALIAKALAQPPEPVTGITIKPGTETTH